MHVGPGHGINVWCVNPSGQGRGEGLWGQENYEQIEDLKKSDRKRKSRCVKLGINGNGSLRIDLNGESLSVPMLQQDLGGKRDAHEVSGSQHSQW